MIDQVIEGLDLFHKKMVDLCEVVRVNQQRISELESNKPTQMSERNSEWISVEDRLPEVVTFVIVCAFNNEIRSAWLSEGEFDERVWYTSEDYKSGYYKLDDVSHWMPLPEPPEDR